MQSENEELFRQAKELIKAELSSIAYDTWISPLKILSIDDDKITIRANTDYNADFLGKRFGDLIINTFKYLTNKERALTIIYNDEKTNRETINDVATPSDSEKELEAEIELSNKVLNPKYTFDTFVVGNNNRFAQAAALAVADKPSEAYNPLFLYGGVGLGKTHLMHAIGNRTLKNFRNFKILYVTSEKFTNQLINAIKDNKNEFFRNKYRNIDVLLIDDIQFIAGKERVQEEFFHTFNALYNSKKQIILSSDKPPKELDVLEERLRSRFSWGLPVDIQPPNYETKVAILRKRAELDNIYIDDEIFDYIATHIKSNIRDLEGALNKIKVYSKLNKKPIDLELSKIALQDLIDNKTKQAITPELIMQTVAEHFNIQTSDIISKKRSHDIAYPRQICMYLCKKMTDQSLVKIGEIIGKRDHSTVIHGIEKIEKDLDKDPELSKVIDVITKKMD